MPADSLSPFGRILRHVVETTPGVHGAVFTDSEGEPVDQYARGPTIEIQIVGAQWGLVLAQVAASLWRSHAGAPTSIYVQCERVQIYIRAITPEYFIVLQASPDAHLGKTIANLEQAAHEMARQM
jgi:predicted regulator of Ras-like GTPase activity (Roadblock/LC7/MglB family)